MHISPKFRDILTKFVSKFAKFIKFSENSPTPPQKSRNFAEISFPEKGVKNREKNREIRANTKIWLFSRLRRFSAL